MILLAVETAYGLLLGVLWRIERADDARARARGRARGRARARGRGRITITATHSHGKTR